MDTKHLVMLEKPNEHNFDLQYDIFTYYNKFIRKEKWMNNDETDILLIGDVM